MFKGGKLKFKGSNKSSNVNKSREKLVEESLVIIPKEISSLPDEGWIKATEPEDFLGPIIFLMSGEASEFLILKVKEECSVSGGGGSVAGGLMFEAATNGGDEPLSTANVLVGQNLIPNVFSFKSSFGKYLTCDSIGQISCSKEAVSPLAEWTLIIKPEGVSLQNVNQKFISFDSETGRLRCDSETIGFNETFIVKCQSDRKKMRLIDKFNNERRSNLKIGTSQAELTSIEEDESKKMQSFGWGRAKHSSTSSNSPSDLKRAADEGNLRETLLDRRIKSKHDPFC